MWTIIKIPLSPFETYSKEAGKLLEWMNNNVRQWPKVWINETGDMTEKLQVGSSLEWSAKFFQEKILFDIWMMKESDPKSYEV